MATACSPVSEALAAGALHAAAAHHHLQQLADADARLRGVDEVAGTRSGFLVPAVFLIRTGRSGVDSRQQLRRRLELESGI